MMSLIRKFIFLFLKVVTKEGVDLNRILVTYCQTGIRASTLKLVLNYIGAQNVAVYNVTFLKKNEIKF